MKKIFYCACIAALATACTNEDLVSENVGTVSKGITFDTTIEGVGVDSRGELTSGYNFFWYAETDRINVYADRVVAGDKNNDGCGVVTDWATLPSPAVYKATKSAGQGQFTAQDDENMIAFEGDKYKSYFVALYPTTTTIEEGSSANSLRNETTDVYYSIGVKKDNTTQTVAMGQVDAPMYSNTTGKRNADYESVGEKMSLSFKRPFPVLRFTSATNSTELDGVIGKLSSINVTTDGAEDDGGYTLEATKIAANSATYDFSNAPELVGGSNAATVKLTAAETWGAGENVFMSIYPVVRKGTDGSGVAKQMTEKYSVTYTYENVTLTKELSTKADWNIENAVYEIQELNIANDFAWIVTNKNSDGERTLYVFKGNFSDIYDAEDKTKIVWKSEGEDGLVSVEEITEIISDVALKDAELQSLEEKYTSLKKLTLKANTSIPGGVFGEKLAGELTDLNLPLVSAFDHTDQIAFSALKNLDVNSYAFAEDKVYTLFFNNNIKSTLETLKIEAVTSLRETFGYSRNIVFTDYTNLTSVALNQTSVALTASAFEGCVSLKEVTGKVDIANAPRAFYKASKSATEHPTINVVNTIIPNQAFAEALIKDIKKGDNQVVPTEVGERAFQNNTLIEVMDLSKATVIGEYAFLAAKNFVGAGAEDNHVVTVVAETLNKQILGETAVVRVQLTAAKTLDNKVFGGCTSLKQIKFLAKVEKVLDKAVPFDGLTTKNVALFVPTTQDDVNGLTWNLVGSTFKSITKEDTKWGE